MTSPLSEQDMTETMTAIMNGEWADEKIRDFLIMLHNRGETVEELTGAARVLREKASEIKGPYDAVDCCGTGGDNSGTYNISTAVALVAAACGVPIAKHGNRASTSKSGTADVLEILGVPLEVSKETLEEALKLFKFAFLMAPHHHTAMKHVSGVRKSIPHRTIFNLLGPLANPANTRFQLIGVFDKDWLRPVAETLRNLKTKRAWIVHGSDGLDEITTTGPTRVATLNEEGLIEERTLTPKDFGLPPSTPKELKGGSAQENAKALRALLEGQKCAYRNIVLANTAAVLHIHTPELSLKEGVQKASKAIDTGAAHQLLKDYIVFCREALGS